MYRNNDTWYPFRQDSNFHYLTAWPEQDAHAVIIIRDSKSELHLFVQDRNEEMETWEVDFTKPQEKKVYEAVLVLFDSADEIEIFNKKAIYLYLREITGMNTKQVVTQLNKMRKRYKEFRDDWNDGKI